MALAWLSLVLGVGARTDAHASTPVKAAACEYQVVAGSGAGELRVEARLEPGRGGSLLLDSGSWRFVRDLEVDEGRGWVRRTLRDEPVDACQHEQRPCRARYRFLLAEAAQNLGRRRGVFGQDDVIVARTSVWLARPSHSRQGDLYRLNVVTPPGLAFVTAMPPSEASASVHEAPLEDLEDAPLGAFGRLSTHLIAVPGATVELATVPGGFKLPEEAIRSWVERSAGAVASYFGRFPLSRTLVLLLPGRGSSVGYGTTRGGRVASIVVWVGREAAESDLASDWVLVHEMTHLGFPNVPQEQHWLEEGLATYLEPIAKVRHGMLSAEEMWRELHHSLPRGVAAVRAQGLDGVRSIDSLYWGGALFWFLADIEIRERTENRKSLDDALRGIVEAGGTIAVRWPLARLFEAGDRAAGVAVLKPLYERMGPASMEVDAERIWQRLGVRVEGAAVRFDDTAPLAAIRRGITAPTPRP